MPTPWPRLRAPIDEMLHHDPEDTDEEIDAKVTELSIGSCALLSTAEGQSFQLGTSLTFLNAQPH